MVNGKGEVHPGSLPLASIAHTHEMMTLLHDLVTCIPSTLFQFCSIHLDKQIPGTFQDYIDNIFLFDLVAEESWYQGETSQCATLSGVRGEEDYSPDFFFDTYPSI